MTTEHPTAPVPGRTIAQLLADGLVSAGVEIAFTVPGESFLPLLDALPPRGIRVIAARHEGGAGFMAEAWGQLTGRPAAVIVTRAVGASNLAIAIHTARQGSTPLIAIVGQVRRDLLGREAFQEADLVGSIGKLAKWAVELRDPAVAPGAIEEAFHRAVDGRPGPVLISVPEDVFTDTTPDRRFANATRPTERRDPEPALARVMDILRLVAAADRPVILAGGGVLRSRGTRDLVRLAEVLEIPVVAGWRRGDVFPNDHRLYLGMAGYGSPPAVRERLEEADVILVLGSRLSEVTTFGYAVPAPEARWAHVDREPRAAGSDDGEPVISLAADADAFLRAAVRCLAGNVHDKDRYDARRDANARDRERFVAETVVDAEPWAGPGVHPGRVVAALQAALSPTTVLTTDAGNFAGWVARGFRFRRPGTFLGPLSGAMGYGLPAAVAAALVAPDRPVVAVCGDGGFAMTMGELETAVRYQLPVVAVVFDDRRYGMILDHQLRGGHESVGTTLGHVDFAAVARACGAAGYTVDDDAELVPALAEALRERGPAVIHLKVDPRWLSVDRRLDAEEEPAREAEVVEPAPSTTEEPDDTAEPPPSTTEEPDAAVLEAEIVAGAVLATELDVEEAQIFAVAAEDGSFVEITEIAEIVRMEEVVELTEVADAAEPSEATESPEPTEASEATDPIEPAEPAEPVAGEAASEAEADATA
jgi:acetolactate synthase-1/2/3 large subunit